MNDANKKNETMMKFQHYATLLSMFFIEDNYWWWLEIIKKIKWISDYYDELYFDNNSIDQFLTDEKSKFGK